MNKWRKFKNAVKRAWNDNSGFQITTENVGWVIGALTLAGVTTAIGITAAKHTASDIATDLGSFSVDASGVTGTSATDETFTLNDGNRSVDTVTLKN
ncbi:hypothetical protein [Desulfoscipio geothermicus]|uniref:Uncharacterized protein n=1 Tax=Desulfoscipio geothermicus DSM 3669 TaxID=1121426 RepID=A0A1I6E4C2_9FIRM|nr:hypothetical protein [Desulfoscipio geothermicus]SFR12600.1 hypothetical protein SAMN05660706_12562 [Desulfoscipio geothermicus DSM 3669]